MKGHPILVAVDGSAAADAAVGAAVELAEAIGSPVLFVHAASGLAEQLFREDAENGPSQEHVVESDPVLAAAIGRARAAGVDAAVEVVDSRTDTRDVAAVIAGIADGLDARVIVCGSRGRGAAAGAVLGSVSHNLIKYASVPVLVVHAPNGDRERPSDS
jgi:nucleotide-binding universal stress UspA family protein